MGPGGGMVWVLGGMGRGVGGHGGLGGVGRGVRSGPPSRHRGPAWEW